MKCRNLAKENLENGGKEEKRATINGKAGDDSQK
jgi:hypothetical protein